MSSARDAYRWRLYAETPVHPWVMSRRIFAGDFVLVKEEELAKGHITQAWRYESRLAAKEGMVIGGVAMTGGRREVADQVRVTTTGGFEFPVTGTMPTVGDFVAPDGPAAVCRSVRFGSVGEVYRVDEKQRTALFTLHGTEVNFKME